MAAKLRRGICVEDLAYFLDVNSVKVVMVACVVELDGLFHRHHVFSPVGQPE